MQLTNKSPQATADRNMVASEKMANEHTPLIATVRTAPPHQRYQNHVVRRFCTIALSCTLLGLFALLLLPYDYAEPLWHHDHGHHHGHHGHHGRPNYQDLKRILLDTPSSEKAREWQHYYTTGAHLAGQNYSQVSGVGSVIAAFERLF